MHLVKIELENIKSLTSFKWELKPTEARAGWHVFLGDNGAGKSSLLKSVAMAMLTLDNIPRASLVGMLQEGKAQAKIATTAKVNEEWDSWNGKRLKDPTKFTQTLTITHGKPSHELKLEGKFSGFQVAGFFSASFGPQRRFSGASQESEKLAKALPDLARHLSIFGEDAAFVETLSWLKDLHYRQLDELNKGITPSPAGQFLQGLRAFINQDGFLPNGAQLHEVSPNGVDFCDANGAIVEIAEMSDGFRSILSMTMELIRQLVISFGMERVFNPNYTEVMPEGVVIVDEIDAHLHPRWQRAIGPWLTRHFPNMQFLVSTHSLFVCQGAVKGTVTRLPQPGSDDNGGRITGINLDRLLYGDIVEAMSSGAFGEEVGRSDIAEQMLLELARLNVRARNHAMDEGSQERRHYLRKIFALAPDERVDHA